MPVIEYMFQLDDKGKKIIPGFVKDRGYWYNETDNTYLGWLDSDRDYWVPDTIETKTKQQCLDRMLAIHTNDPITQPDPSDPGNEIAMDSAEVTSMIETWYDSMVSRNQS